MNAGTQGSPPRAGPAPRLLRGLARRQIIVTIVIALLGGLLVGGIELALDWSNLRHRIESGVQRSLGLVKDSAATAAFNINREQALGVASGLLRDPAIVHVRLTDNFGTVLANERMERPTGPGVSSLIVTEQDLLRLPLTYREGNGPPLDVGLLEVRIDPGASASDFLPLAGWKLVLRVGEAVLLSIVLVLVFYRTVIHPLTRMAQRVTEIDPAHPAARPIPIPEQHLEDEFGALARTLNSLLQEFQTSLDRQAAAQDALSQLNTQLEAKVDARTAELRHAMAELEVKKEAAEQAARSKSEFLATVSHELRTPMNGVLGCVDLLGMSALDAEQREFLGIIRDSGNHLLSLINDILDYSSLEAGSLAFEPTDVALAETLQQIEQMFAARAKEKRLVLRLDGGDPAQMIRTEPKRLLQVLANLVGNAIKFTSTGSVSVGVTRAGNVLRLTVTDTGIGIKPEDMDKLFVAFSQVDGSATRRYGGTGLGLAISRRLVEGMGGRIGVESTPGLGSSFWFELPAGD
jgi:two-component system, sensor histidine kinase SagS